MPPKKAKKGDTNQKTVEKVSESVDKNTEKKSKARKNEKKSDTVSKSGGKSTKKVVKQIQVVAMVHDEPPPSPAASVASVGSENSNISNPAEPIVANKPRGRGRTKQSVDEANRKAKKRVITAEADSPPKGRGKKGAR